MAVLSLADLTDEVSHDDHIDTVEHYIVEYQRRIDVLLGISESHKLAKKLEEEKKVSE